MNAAIRRVAVAAMIMVVALLLQLTWVQVFRADELRADSRNTRMLLDEYSRQRGQITAGGRVLAMSLPADGRTGTQPAPGQPEAPAAPVDGMQHGAPAANAAEQSGAPAPQAGSEAPRRPHRPSFGQPASAESHAEPSADGRGQDVPGEAPQDGDAPGR